MKRSKIFSGCCNSLQWFLMSKNNRKLHKNHINRKNIIWWQNKHKSPNKRSLSAEGCSLLPSALRPRLLALVLIPGISLVVADVGFSASANAASMTLTIPTGFSLDITPTSDGNFAKSNPYNINIKTDSNGGYVFSIKAQSSENGNSLLNGNNKLNSISEKTTEDSFRNDTKFNNAWGYLPSKFSGIENTEYLPGPSNEENVIDDIAESNNDTGNDYNFTLAAKVDGTMPSGLYGGGFVFSVVSNIKEPMQNWQGCDGLSDGTTVTLVDTRDDNTYTVAKLKDGKCWMTQNLRLGDEKLTLKNPERKLTPEDSAIEEGEFTIPASDLSAFGTSQNTSYVYVDTENNDNGGYYSWRAATAGQNNIMIGGSLDSICPKGWHLPTKDEFSNLIANSNYTSSTIKAAPANFTTPGYVNNKKVSSNGTYGYYWSAGNYSSSNTYSDALNVYSSSTNPKLDYWQRYYGNSIRCVAGDIEIKDYSITYDLNGGSGEPAPNPQTGKLIGNGNTTITDTEPTWAEHTFLGWCTTNPGDSIKCSGKTYQKGASYPLDSTKPDTTLYAIWRGKTPYKITYNLNGGSGGPAPNPQTGETVGLTMNLSSNQPTKSGRSFMTWCTKNPGTSKTCSGTSYAPGAEYELTAGSSNEVTLYAVWGPEYLSTCNGTGKVLKDGMCWSKDEYYVSYDNVSNYCTGVWRLPSANEYGKLKESYLSSCKAFYDTRSCSKDNPSHMEAFNTFNRDFGITSNKISYSYNSGYYKYYYTAFYPMTISGDGDFFHYSEGDNGYSIDTIYRDGASEGLGLKNFIRCISDAE